MTDRLTSLSWREFIRRLKTFGFVGPFAGGKHPYMVKGNLVLTVPNPHKGDISVPLLIRILKQAGISKEKWTSV